MRTNASQTLAPIVDAQRGCIDRNDNRPFPTAILDGDVITLTTSELALFIEGCELVGHRKLSPVAVVPTPLAR